MPVKGSLFFELCRIARGHLPKPSVVLRIVRHIVGSYVNGASIGSLQSGSKKGSGISQHMEPPSDES